jgi:serine phosphatase RsbU (regulator of sigma subunit)
LSAPAPPVPATDRDILLTLAEIARDMAALRDLDELLAQIARHVRRVVEYRTFGILLLNEATGELEIKTAVQYGERVALPNVRLGEGLVGHAALHGEPVLVPDVSTDPRYIRVVEDVRSELVVPMRLKDRAIGVFDLESPELDAFTQRDVEMLKLLANQAAVAIDNARLYEELSAYEARLEKELLFAKRVQAALLPTEPPKRLKGLDVAASFSAARELGGDFHDFLVPEPRALVVLVGDVSGKGVPAALYSAFAGELVRGRTVRRRTSYERSPAALLTSINTTLRERQIEEYYCTLCYVVFDLRQRTVTLANSGLPFPVLSTAAGSRQIQLPGVPLGSFFGVTYDELTLPMTAGDCYLFCTDGVSEAMNSRGEEFGAERLMAVVQGARERPAADIVAAIARAVESHRAGFPPNDDMTIVAVRVTA